MFPDGNQSCTVLNTVVSPCIGWSFKAKTWRRASAGLNMKLAFSVCVSYCRSLQPAAEEERSLCSRAFHGETTSRLLQAFSLTAPVLAKVYQTVLSHQTTVLDHSHLSS